MRLTDLTFDSPLLSAAFTSNAHELAELLAAGAAIDERSTVPAYAGYTALHLVAAARSMACAQLLISAGADPRVVDGQDRRPVDLLDDELGSETFGLCWLLETEAAFRDFEEFQTQAASCAAERFEEALDN